MDSKQYSTLMDALADIPDPRKRRGKRHNWHLLVVLLVSGLASGYQSARAIAHWAKLINVNYICGWRQLELSVAAGLDATAGRPFGCVCCACASLAR